MFNRIKSEGHFQLLKEAVEKETHVPVVGYIRPDSNLTIPDRHLGLRTALEGEDPEFYSRLAQVTMATLDLSRIEQLAKGSPDWEEPLASEGPRSVEPLGESVRVGVAHDPAFCFYYPDNLAFLEEAGGELVRFSPMQDTKLPEVDILYLGGGYLEVSMPLCYNRIRPAGLY